MVSYIFPCNNYKTEIELKDCLGRGIDIVHLEPLHLGALSICHCYQKENNMLVIYIIYF